MITPRLLVLSLLLTAFSSAPMAQTSVESDLAFYGDAMTNASVPEHRERAGKMFYELFPEYLSANRHSMMLPESLPWVLQVVPTDSSFRVISWQIDGAQGPQYYGFIVPGDPGADIIPLQDNRPLAGETASYSAEHWYGAIYYGIQDFRTSDGRTAYVVLGFDAHSPQSNRRIADVLSFSANEVSFGMPVFWADTLGQEYKNRVIVEYSDAAAATMRFDREQEMLIYDHVIPINTPEGPTFVPDGSYHGYRYRSGKWELVNKVFNLIMDEPPGGRLKEQVKKDLFGRPVEKQRSGN